MLQWIRDKLHGLIIWFIIGMIILVFVLGASNYLFNRSSYNKIVAKVDGESINIYDVNSLYHAHIKQYYSKQKSYNQHDLDPKTIKSQLLGSLINQMAVVIGLQNSGFIITDEYLVNVVKNDANFQDNGKFSVAKYANFLQKISLTELEYQQYLRKYFLIDQLRSGLLLSSFVPLPEVDNFIAKWNQSRNFGFVIVPFKRFIQAEVTEQAIEEHYNKNKKSYVTPSTVSIAYLDVTAHTLVNKVKINRDELYKYYQEHTEYYTLPSLVNIRHILIAAPTASMKEKNNAARSQAEDLLARLKLGQDFTKLAKEYSHDQNSASDGGNLGWIGKGEVDADFEQAAFNLAISGDLSDLVQSKFGYHIIQLIDKRESKTSNFEQVMDQVTKHYKEEIAQAKLQDLYEELSNPIIANEDLSKLAKKFELEVKFAGPFTSSGTTNGVASYSEVVMAAFDEKNLNKNSDLIKLAEDHFIILRVTNKQPAAEQTLLDAHDQIKEILQTSLAKQQAKEYGLELAKKLLVSTSPNKIAKSHDVDWNLVTATRETKDINLEILQAAFSLAKPKMQKSFNLANGDFVIVQLLSTQDADLKKMLEHQQDLKEQMREQLTHLQGHLEQKLYEKDLFNSAKIKYTSNIERW